MIYEADTGTQAEIEELIAGRTIEKPIHEEITYADIHSSQDNLWNFLFFTGYLKKVSERFEIDTVYLNMAIPNMEVRYIYSNQVREWFEEKKKQRDYRPLYESLLNADAQGVEDFICAQLSESISYYDNAESFYHGYMLGIVSGMMGYKISSNREQGNGRADLTLEPNNPKKTAVIFEFKICKKFTEMETGSRAALAQINEMKYADALLDEGYRHILKYGICFCKKSCMVQVGD